MRTYAKNGGIPLSKSLILIAIVANFAAIAPQNLYPQSESDCLTRFSGDFW
jgi:hypothetical protein